MQATELQLDVLQLSLKYPSWYSERRVESLVDLGSDHLSWSYQFQFRKPEIALTSSEPLYFSLGIFKKERLPDLQAFDDQDRRLSMLSRGEQNDVLISALLQSRIRHLADGDRASLLHAGWRIMSLPPAEAEAALLDFQGVARAVDPTSATTLTELVRPFVSSALVIAILPSSSAARCVISVRFTERYQLEPSFWARHQGWAPGKLPLLLWNFWLLVMMRIGLASVPLRLRFANANHAHSFYALVGTPEGVEAESIYWQESHPRPVVNANARNYESPKSRSHVLACYHHTDDVNGGIAEVNLRLYGPGLRLIWLLVVLLGFVGTYIAQTASSNGPPTSDVSAWLPVVPAALLALINQRSSEMRQFMGRVLQRLLLVLVILSLLVGIRAASQFSPGALKDVPLIGTYSGSSPVKLGRFLASYAMFLAIVVGQISFRSSPAKATSRVKDPSRATFLDYSRFHARRNYATSATLLLAVGTAIATYYALPWNR